MAIPYGPDIQVFGTTVPLSVINVDVGFLFIFAVSSLAVYGVTIAGWASNNKYSLLGSLRASAQMISYEIPLGMSLIPIVLIYGSLDLNKIVEAQNYVWKWGVFLSPISFLLFLIAMFAETNRAPFDLAEAEGEPPPVPLPPRRQAAVRRHHTGHVAPAARAGRPGAAARARAFAAFLAVFFPPTGGEGGGENKPPVAVELLQVG
jgi:hypothetical protein